MRLRRIPGIEQEFASYPHLIKREGELKKGEWRQLFEREQPLYLEIGMGRGQFLKSISRAMPEINFIGLELQNEIVARAAKNLGDDSDNVVIIQGHAQCLENWFNAREVERIYLNFSDPWPKARHSKRRLTHRNFLQQYRTILKPKGDLFFRTDVASLFEFTLVEMAHCDFVLQALSLNFHESSYFDGFTTEYEDRQSKKGPIYFAHFVVV